MSILDTYRTSHKELMQPYDAIVEDAITNLSEVKPIKNNTFTAIPNQLKAWKNLTKHKIIPKPSNFFKIGRLKNLDIENKKNQDCCPRLACKSDGRRLSNKYK